MLKCKLKAKQLSCLYLQVQYIKTILWAERDEKLVEEEEEEERLISISTDNVYCSGMQRR